MGENGPKPMEGGVVLFGKKWAFLLYTVWSFWPKGGQIPEPPLSTGLSVFPPNFLYSPGACISICPPSFLHYPCTCVSRSRGELFGGFFRSSDPSFSERIHN